MRKVKEKYITPIVCFLTPDFPSKIIIDHIEGSLWEYNIKERIKATCVNCIDIPCKVYSENELLIEEFKSMPSNSTLNVCPSNAFELFNNKPVISPSKCISCGICIQRCMYNAISINKTESAEICHENNEKIKFSLRSCISRWIY